MAQGHHELTKQEIKGFKSALLKLNVVREIKEDSEWKFSQTLKFFCKYIRDAPYRKEAAIQHKFKKLWKIDIIRSTGLYGECKLPYGGHRIIGDERRGWNIIANGTSSYYMTLDVLMSDNLYSYFPELADDFLVEE